MALRVLLLLLVCPALVAGQSFKPNAPIDARGATVGLMFYGEKLIPCAKPAKASTKKPAATPKSEPAGWPGGYSSSPTLNAIGGLINAFVGLPVPTPPPYERLLPPVPAPMPRMDSAVSPAPTRDCSKDPSLVLRYSKGR